MALYQGSIPISNPIKHGSQHGTNGNDPITPESIGAAVNPQSIKVTLSSSGWDSTAKTQTVTATGVLSDETAQLITPTPALASQTAYYDAGILCTGQGADSLTFTANTVPTEDLVVYVTIQEVEYTEPPTPEVTLINFTINGTSYQAEEGMTWAEWCASAYNTDGYTTNGDNTAESFIWDRDMMGSVSDPDKLPPYCVGAEVIVANTAYVWEV